MSLLNGLLLTWAVLTALLVLLIIYRGVVGMHEDDCLFLTPGESGFRQEQEATLARLQKLRPYIHSLSAASGVLVLAITGVWIAQWMGQF